MKLYIAGPIRGHEAECLKDFNDAEAALLAHDYEVYNPLEKHAHLLEKVGSLTVDELKQIFRDDIEGLLGCDGIALLPGWGESIGAQGEYFIARACQMRVEMVGDWLRLLEE